VIKAYLESAFYRGFEGVLLWHWVAAEDDEVGLGEPHDEDAVDDAEPGHKCNTNAVDDAEPGHKCNTNAVDDAEPG
jgi:hypothetical protein